MQGTPANGQQASVLRSLRRATELTSCRPASLLRASSWAAVLGVAVLLGGCSSVLNPSFQSLVASPVPDENGTFAGFTIDNAPGHVPVVLINNTTFDQQLLNFLRDTGTDVDGTNLRPRIRLRVEVTYSNNNTNTFEMIDGSPLIQGDVDEPPPADLIMFDLDTWVAICDVAVVEPVQVEVFVPTQVTEITIVETENTVQREVVNIEPPQFVLLQADTVDDNSNVEVAQNFDIRQQPVLVSNVMCGAVIAFEISGTLTLPFTTLDAGGTFPGYLDTDTGAQAAAPGRFAFETTVR